jgi:hypothetical protein
MRPEGTKVWRKEGRRAVRGIPTGRRTTHRVRTEQTVTVDSKGSIRVAGVFVGSVLPVVHW